MELNERKLKILQAIVQDYIQTAEPIGSRTLTKRYSIGVSPATIRNEMADLEDLGYLTQPHTSAGRIPSDKAYRLYVDYLLQMKKIATFQRDTIKSSLIKRFGELEDVLQYSSKILSQLTNYTSIAMAPQIKGSKLKHIQLVPIGDEHIIAMIVTDTGVIKKPLLKISGGMDYDFMMRVSTLLNEKLTGLTIQDIEQKLVGDLRKEAHQFSDIIDTVVPQVFKTLEEIDDFELFMNGTTNIFNFPEFSDVLKAKSFLTMLEEKALITNMITASESNGIKISIGSENPFQEAKDCSLVTATFNLEGNVMGWLSVIGPTRMDYSHVISVMQQISSYINQILKER
ncbi:heat-inducible transcriptional repressor HrcA [Alkaliphilus hydrothermalis]|uniref:Heat-inducible transcription repressor HrcA n=1 Tax=Alkaliphilus hydrothermalis TaxID=1482730 RepID=A0ABS2NP09_9FIRM|nr:heat-inducible transcriptional repressor HrcA [Alkaliphilus hydrothermalis]MBM7614665.1 heat-inducible transcriptional repressor [Alkaliphilus hydrothermalis]